MRYTNPRILYFTYVHLTLFAWNRRMKNETELLNVTYFFSIACIRVFRILKLTAPDSAESTAMAMSSMLSKVTDVILISL